MKRIIWDKLIINNGEYKENTFATVLYHYEGSDVLLEMMVPFKDIDLMKKRLAIQNNIQVNLLKRYGYLEERSIEDDNIMTRILLKEQVKDDRAKQEFLDQHAVVGNIKVSKKNIRTILQNMCKLSKIIARTFVGYKENNILNTIKSSLFSYHSYDGKIDDISKVIIRDYPKTENIIYNLVVGNDHLLDEEDVSYLKDYLEWISRVNNNSNNGFFEFSLFSIISKGLYVKEAEILRKVEDLYNNIHTQDFMGKYSYNKENAIKYLLYVMTLTSGGENTTIYEDSEKYEVASIEEAYEFNKMSDIGRLYILSQIKDVLVNNEMDFDKLNYRIYSFNTQDFHKKVFIDNLNQKINKVVLEMKRKMQNKRKK